ncbi:MAG: DUF433 domain-containing protein [Pyrinomonadaceae bacterium]
MAVVEKHQEVPLTATTDGTIRITGSPVSLDSVIHHYRHGATAEEIALRFPGLGLADIHSTIAYCLNHQEEIDDYLAEREHAASDLRERISSDPFQQQGISEMRERIKARRVEGKRNPS